MSKKERRRLRRRASHEGAAPQPISVVEPVSRRQLPPPRWLLMGALAAGAVVSSEAATAGIASAAHSFAKERPPLVAAAGAGGGDGEVRWSYGGEGESAAGGARRQTTAPAVPFEVPAGKLAEALEAFSAQAGVRVQMATPSMGELPSPGVEGTYPLTDALALLLEGTGATFETLPGGELRIVAATLRAEIDVVDSPRVLSPRFTEPLVDMPQSVTVVGTDLIQAQAASSLRDVLRNVTGISIQAGEGGGGLPGDSLAIRGFAARNDIFVDGVRDFGSYSRDPFNVEQVEVSKGPASVFAGRGSTGGAINLATKVPTLEAGATGTAAAGTDDFQRATLDLNRPLPEALGGAAFRLNAMFTHGDTPGRDEVRNERFGIAPSFAAGLAGRTRLWLSGSLLEEDNVPEYGIPWVPATNAPLAAHADRPAPVDFDNFYGLVDRDYEKTSTAIATARVEHDLEGGPTLRAQVRSGRSDRDSVITAPRFASTTSTDLNRQLQARDLEDRILDGRVDVVAKGTLGGVDHSLVAGVEVSRETAENRARTGPPAPVADLFDPDPHAPYAGPIEHTGARTESTADTVAAFAFDTVRLGERFEVMAGARYDRLEVGFDNRAADGSLARFGREDDMLSWRSGVVFKPRPAGSFYAAYGTSFNPSAEGNTGLSLTDATVLLEPERSRSAEVGTKWELLGRRVLATAALFETEKTNARTPGIDPFDPPTVLEGRQRVRGAEVGLNGLLAPGWQASAGYTYLDSEVVESNNPTEVGNELANTPEHSFSAWTSYRFPWGVEIGGGAQYVGDRWNNTANVRRAPGYWNLDAMAAYDINERLTLRINLYNLTDERYIDRVGGGHFVPGAGRSGSLTTGFRF